MGVYIEGLDIPKEHSLWMVIHPNGQVWMRKRHYCQNLEDVEATELDLVRCKDCKHSKNCVYPAKWNWCPDGERGAEQSQINTIENTNETQSKEAIKEVVKDYIKATYGSIDNL